MQVRGILAVAAVVALAAPAVAQDKKAAPSLVDALAACLDIRDDPARLACTDVAARKLVEASQRKEVVILDREEVKTTRRSLFGFQLPRIGLFGRDGPDKGEEIDKLDAKIVSVGPREYGKYSLQIEGGARWTTTEAWGNSAPPRVGDVLSIRRGTLGSYFVRIGKGAGVRAMRTG